MRPLRNFKPNRCYHLISRIAHRAFFLTEDERTRFVGRLWRAAGFSGVEVLAYCFMSNHFHLLVYVPEAADLNDEELFVHIEQTIPESVPRLLEKGCNKVAFDVLRLLSDGPKRPADLRAMLGMASANFFTARDLTPLANAGYIGVVGGESSHSPCRKYRLLAKGKRFVA